MLRLNPDNPHSIPEPATRVRLPTPGIPRSAKGTLFVNDTIMKRFVFALVVLLLQGCLTFQRSWTLGVCRPETPGAYGCEIRVPRSRIGVSLIAEIKPADTVGGKIIGLKFRIQNKDSRTIEIQGLDKGNVYLNAGESFEVTSKPGAGNGWTICSLPTGKGAIRLRLEVVGELPPETSIRILGHSSDAL